MFYFAKLEKDYFVFVGEAGVAHGDRLSVYRQLLSFGYVLADCDALFQELGRCNNSVELPITAQIVERSESTVSRRLVFN